MPFTLYVDSLFTSPYALSAFVALTEKRLPFAMQTVDLEAGQQKLGAYRDRALTARVPALVEDGGATPFVLTESTAITEYLEDTFPAPEYVALYPKDRRQRAQARQVQAWLRSDLLQLRVERDTETVFFGKACQPLSEAAPGRRRQTAARGRPAGPRRQPPPVRRLVRWPIRRPGRDAAPPDPERRPGAAKVEGLRGRPVAAAVRSSCGWRATSRAEPSSLGSDPVRGRTPTFSGFRLRSAG